MSATYSQKLKRKKRDLFELLLGYSCNANCQFCSIDPAKRKINSGTKELIGSIYQAKKDGFKYLGIGGGEPTIRKDLVSLISFAKKLKFDAIRIETNGIALSYPEYCRRLVEAGLDFVKISIHSHKPEIHDSLTCVPGAFKKILKAIENLQKLRVRIEINTVINKMNYKSYLQFVNFFVKKGIGTFCFIYPLYTGRMAENWREIGISMKGSICYLKEAFDLVDSLELDKWLVFNFPYCFMEGYEKKVIEQYGMKLASPDRIINDADVDIRAGKIKLIGCKKCQHNLQCSGIWKEYIRRFGRKEFIK